MLGLKLNHVSKRGPWGLFYQQRLNKPASPWWPGWIIIHIKTVGYNHSPMAWMSNHVHIKLLTQLLILVIILANTCSLKRPPWEILWYNLQSNRKSLVLACKYLKIIRLIRTGLPQQKCGMCGKGTTQWHGRYRISLGCNKSLELCTRSTFPFYFITDRFRSYLSGLFHWHWCTRTIVKVPAKKPWGHVDGSLQDPRISVANALEILQSCTKPSMCR